MNAWVEKALPIITASELQHHIFGFSCPYSHGIFLGFLYSFFFHIAHDSFLFLLKWTFLIHLQYVLITHMETLILFKSVSFWVLDIPWA